MFGQTRRPENCKKYAPLLWDYGAGRISDEERNRLETHLAHCSACRALARQQARAAGLFFIYEEDVPMTSASAWPQMRPLLQAREHQAKQRRQLLARRFAAVLAACGVASAVSLSRQQGSRSKGALVSPESTALGAGGAPAYPAPVSPTGGTAKESSRRLPFHLPQPAMPPTQDRIAHSTKDNYGNPLASALPDARSMLAMRASAQAVPAFASPAPGVRPFPKRAANSGVSFSAARDVRLTANVRRTDDLNELNADPALVLAGWARRSNPAFTGAFARRLTALEREIKAGDDFVYVPLPRLAAAGSRPQQARLAQAALAAYRQEKEVVDTRLTRKVSLGVKSLSLDELCRRLKEKTDVDVWAGKSVVDEKIILFCDDQPLREIMRQINRLFGFQWIRSGEEGHYRYQLWQNVREQLAEEEMRNRDRDEAIIDLDGKMANYKPDKRFQEWGAVQLYNQFSPADFAALRRGEAITFAGWDKAGARPLPLEINQAIVTASNSTLTPNEFAWPDYNADVTFHLNFSELGQVKLQADMGVFKKGVGGYGVSNTLATGLSPSSAKPNNAQANQAQRKSIELAKVISLNPVHSCPRVLASALGKPRDQAEASQEDAKQRQGQPENADKPRDGRDQSLDRFNRGAYGGGHLLAADVWEEIHKQTGLPIIADSYMRLYPPQIGVVQAKSAYEALNKVADALGSRWKRESTFIACRAANFYWNRMKEVPERLLTRWDQDSARLQGLPLNDFLEMAELSDQQLDSQIVGDAVTQCWGLDEWDALGRPIGYYSPRSFARYLAQAKTGLRRQFMEPEGVAISSLTADERAEFIRAAQAVGKNSYIDFENVAVCRYRMEYIPSQVYVWKPGTDHKYQIEVTIYDRTREGALAKARKVNPAATAVQIVPSPGSFVVVQIDAKGEALLVAGVKTHLLFNPFHAL